MSKNSENDDFIILPPNEKAENYAASIGLTLIEYEQLHSQYNCNLLRASGEWSGGVLYLLNFGLKFVPHEVNVDKNIVSCLYSEIQSIIFFNRILIIPNGLEIRLKNGKTIKLTVEDRTKIAEFINSKI